MADFPKVWVTCRLPPAYVVIVKLIILAIQVASRSKHLHMIHAENVHSVVQSLERYDADQWAVP